MKLLPLFVKFSRKTAYRQAIRYLRAFRESSGLNYVNKLNAIRFIFKLYSGKHSELSQSANSILKKDKKSIASYYLGQQAILFGRYPEAISYLLSFLSYHPQHPDGTYLLAESYFKNGESEQAWLILEALALKTTRVKTWWAMAAIVRTETDYLRLIDCYERVAIGSPNIKKNVKILKYLAGGALWIKNYSAAKHHLNEVKLINQTKTTTLSTSDHHLNQKDANQALQDLKQSFDEANIPFFLVSGTLLGCIREGKFLSHDHDIDVGVWDDISINDIYKAVQKFGLFYITASRSEHLVKLKHVNGINLDVFIHYKTPKSYWHAGIKLKWHNKPFKLGNQLFMGAEYLIPEDYDTYLTENYGDWKTPVKEFDSALHTPNFEILNQDEYDIYNLRKELN